MSVCVATKSLATEFIGVKLGSATLYSDANFSGDNIEIRDSRSNLGDVWVKRNFLGNCTKDWNDRTSSVRNRGSGILVLWADSDYGGKLIMLGNGEYPNLDAYGFNDNANSAGYYSGTNVVFQGKYYRKVNAPEVYFYGSKFTCHVTDPAQMERFGGFDQVVVVSPNINIPNADPKINCTN